MNIELRDEGQDNTPPWAALRCHSGGTINSKSNSWGFCWRSKEEAMSQFRGSHVYQVSGDRGKFLIISLTWKISADPNLYYKSNMFKIGPQNRFNEVSTPYLISSWGLTRWHALCEHTVWLIGHALLFCWGLEN